MNSALLAAMRQASVAIRRERDTPRRRILSEQILQRLDGAGHGGIRQPAGAMHALAQADDPGERVDDEKAAPRGPGDQQAAIIGAEIERAIDGGRAAPGGAAPSFLPWAAPQ